MIKGLDERRRAGMRQYCTCQVWPRLDATRERKVRVRVRVTLKLVGSFFGRLRGLCQLSASVRAARARRCAALRYCNLRGSRSGPAGACVRVLRDVCTAGVGGDRRAVSCLSVVRMMSLFPACLPVVGGWTRVACVVLLSTLARGARGDVNGIGGTEDARRALGAGVTASSAGRRAAL